MRNERRTPGCSLISVINGAENQETKREEGRCRRGRATLRRQSYTKPGICSSSSPLLLLRRGRGGRGRPIAWWRRRRPIGPHRPDTGDLVSLGIHALLIGHVVAPLERILRRSGRTARDSGSGEEAGPRADCGAGAYVTRGGADGRTEPGACQRSDDSSGGEVLVGGLAWRRSAYLLLGPLPARIIISLEYLERLSRDPDTP